MLQQRCPININSSHPPPTEMPPKRTEPTLMLRSKAQRTYIQAFYASYYFYPANLYEKYRKAKHYKVTTLNYNIFT